MTSLQELLKYEWVEFFDCRTNVRDKKSGAKVGRYLAVSGYNNQWKIYEVLGGMPVLDTWVSNLDDAVKIAQYIDKQYGDYLGIYGIWLKADVVGIARLSVPEGEIIYNTLSELIKLNRPINYNDFTIILNKNKCQNYQTSC